MGTSRCHRWVSCTLLGENLNQWNMCNFSFQYNVQLQESSSNQDSPCKWKNRLYSGSHHFRYKESFLSAEVWKADTFSLEFSLYSIYFKMKAHKGTSNCPFNPISHGIFFHWLPRGQADSANHFGTLIRASSGMTPNI